MKLGSKKVVTCKNCGTTNLRWENNGRWVLFDPTINMFHQCPVREVKEVECKYCHANDLWWSKETMKDGKVLNVLMESFGIPHGCDDRKKHFDKLSQDKKDLYAQEKAKIEAIPDESVCGACVHGFVSGVIFNGHSGLSSCRTCSGSGKITATAKRRMLAEVRRRIWPNIGRSRARTD
jgi:hypothetical protein